MFVFLPSEDNPDLSGNAASTPPQLLPPCRIQRSILEKRSVVFLRKTTMMIMGSNEDDVKPIICFPPSRGAQ